MTLNTRCPADTFSGVVVAVLLILTAWGNAIAMLIVSAIAAATWIVVPRIRGQTPIRRGVLAGGIGAAIAFAIGWVMTR